MKSVIFISQEAQKKSFHSGELGRLEVIEGPDKGSLYILVGQKVKLGRGEQNDIVFSDYRTSRSHAEVTLEGGQWFLKDEKSTNGIYLEGKKKHSFPLQSGMIFTLGQTAVRFTTPLSGTSKNSKRFPLLLGAVALVALLLFLEEEPMQEKKGLSQKTLEKPVLSDFLPLPTAGFQTSEKEVELLFNLGRREYFLGNYNRARTHFETVLQIQPDHFLSQIYLQNGNQSVKEEVQMHLEYGKKSFDAGKLRDAKAHFLRVVRLLEKDPKNPAYQEAKTQLDTLLKGEKR